MARKQGHNKPIYEEKLKDAINMALRQTIKDPRLTMVSVTRVELTPDYSHAKVYWDTFDVQNRGKIKEGMDGVASKLRSILAKEMNIRHTPSLSLFYDSQFEDERKIEELLKQDKNAGDDQK